MQTAALLTVYAALLTGYFGLLGASLYLLVTAFRQSITWGLGVLFVPFLSLVFVATHWQDTKRSLFVWLGSFAVAVLGGVLGRLSGTLPEQVLDQTNSRWVQVSSAKANFTSWFPSEPKHTVVPSGHRYLAETKNGTTAFLVSYNSRSNTGSSLEECLDAVRMSKESTNVRTISVTICGHTGKEMRHDYVYRGVRQSSWHRVVFANGGVYQMIVLAPAAQGIPEEDARRFFEGFQLLNSQSEGADDKPPAKESRD